MDTISYGGKTYKVHPAANIFPMMEDQALTGLGNDIKAHGLLQPIELLNGEIIDGRNRLHVCVLRKLEARFVDVSLPRGTGPYEYVVAKNVSRRHLTRDQLAMLADLVRPKVEAEAKTRQEAGKAVTDSATTSENGEKKRAPATRDKLASMFHVGRDKIDDARDICRKDKDLGAKVRRGEMSITSAKSKLGLAEPPKPFDPAKPWSVSRYVSTSKRIAELADHLTTVDQPENMGNGELDQVTKYARAAIQDLETLVSMLNEE